MTYSLSARWKEIKFHYTKGVIRGQGGTESCYIHFLKLPTQLHAPFTTTLVTLGDTSIPFTSYLAFPIVSIGLQLCFYTLMIYQIFKSSVFVTLHCSAVLGHFRLGIGVERWKFATRRQQKQHFCLTRNLEALEKWSQMFQLCKMWHLAMVSELSSAEQVFTSSEAAIECHSL